MKTAHINQIIEMKQDPRALIAYHLDSNISFPIFKTSEKTLMSQDGKTTTTITELFCTKCNEHFVQHGNKCNNPTCPNCGNVEDAFHPYANTDINANTMFSNDIDVVVVDTISGLSAHRTSLKNIKIGNASANSRKNSRSEIAILSKEQIDGETIFVMRQYEMFLLFDVESNKRECVLLDTKNMLLFAEKEIINIREGRRSSASVSKSWSRYYYQTDRVFLATHDLYIDLQDRVKAYCPNSKLNPISYTNLLDVYTYSINALDATIAHIRESKPVSQRTVKQEAIVQEIIASLPELETFVEKSDKVFYTIIEKDEILRTCKFRYTCPHCGKTATSKMTYHYYINHDAREDAVCPHCGVVIDKTLLHNIASMHNNAFMFNVVQNYKDGVVIRDAKYVCTVQDGECTYTPANDAPTNIFVIPNEVNENSLLKSATIIRYGKKYSISKSFKNDYYNCLHRIKNFATNLNVQWAGLDILDSIGSREGCNIDFLATYVLLYHKYPVMEKLLKEGYGILVVDIIHSYDFQLDKASCNYDLAQNETHKALRVSKGCLRILKMHDSFSAFSFDQLQALYLVDENITAEDYQYMQSNAMPIPKVVDVAKDFGFTIHQICTYIERVRVSQCVAPHIAISEWYDYLVASKVIGCDLTDKRVKYPVALRTEHDKVVYKKNIIENRNYEEAFSDVTKTYGDKYSYKTKDFIITYPKTLSDLFEEGRMLNHCVGTYGDAVKNGKSIILFARRASAPNIPYFTIEVNPTHNAVTQFCGFADASPNHVKHKDLIEFVKQWANKNNIFYK